MERMTTTRIRKETRPGIYRCAATLYLRIFPGRSKSFIQKLSLKSGKRIEIGLGGWPLRSLDEARELAFENRRLVRDGGDPRAAKRAEALKATAPTFRHCAETWYAENRETWAPAAAKRTWARIARYALPAIGDRAVDAIGQSDVLALLVPIFLKNTKRQSNCGKSCALFSDGRLLMVTGQTTRPEMGSAQHFRRRHRRQHTERRSSMRSLLVPCKPLTAALLPRCVSWLSSSSR